jgi:SAM-dependent methyltransferase
MFSTLKKLVSDGGERLAVWDEPSYERFVFSPHVEFLTEAQQHGATAEGFRVHAASVHHLIGRLRERSPKGAERVLDVGCNSGIFTAALAKMSPTAIGVDLSEPLIRCARTRHPNVSFIAADAYALPFGDGEFSIVTNFGLIHYLSRWEEILRESWRVLEPGGLLATQFRQSRSAWTELVRTGIAVGTGRRSFSREVLRLRYKIPWDPRKVATPWMTRDGRPLSSILEFLTGLGGSVIEIHSPRVHWLFPGEHASVIVKKSGGASYAEGTAPLVCRSCYS